MEQEIPGWVLIGHGIASWLQVITGVLAVVILAIIAFILLQVKGDLAGIIKNIHKITEDGTKMSKDAADTTHNVTGAVNRVSNLVGTAATRLESPVIRAVGVASGLFAAGRSMRGAKKETVVVKKKKGLFG